MNRILKRGALVALLGASPPVNTVAPVVTGSHVQGATLTCDPGTWTGATSYAYQWLRDGAEIAGATAATRTVTLTDALAVLTCAVTATGPGGTSAPVSSTPAGPWQPTDLGLETFVHAPWEATADGAVQPLVTDWAVTQRLWGQQTAAAQPLYDADGGDGLAVWDPAGSLRYWDLIVDPPVLTREFTAFTRAKKSSANGYLWQGSASQGPAIVSGFSLGAFYWYGNSGDRYALAALPGDDAIHTAIHLHAATYVRGRFDGADAYNTAKTTVNYTGNSISRFLTTNGGVSWKGAVRTWGILNRIPTSDELATLEAWLADPQPRRTEPLVVSEPAPWQTYQRDLISDEGAIGIAGTIAPSYRLPGVGAQARFDGGAWVDLTVGTDGAVTGTLSGISPARASVEVRLTGPLSSTVTIERVAVGDVYAIAGQSNAMGQANPTALQTSSNALGTALLTTAYRWVGPAADPSDYSAGQIDTVASDGALPSGSPWPILGDLLSVRDGVPVAFVPCAKGATTHAQWVPGADHFDRTTLYGQLAHRAQVSGARAVLWYLGESDALAGASAATVQAHVETIAAAVAADLGIPSYHAKIHSWTSGPSITAVNTGIAAGVAAAANAYAGPDQSAIALGNIHYLTTGELTQLATAWRDALP